MTAPRTITYQGRTDLLSGWSKTNGISVQTMVSRLNAGWSVEETLTSRIHQRGGKLRRQPYRPVKANTVPAAAIATVIMPALKEYERQHRAVEVRMIRAFNEYIQSCVRRDAAIMREIDMQSIGQPAAGTFDTPGVVVDFAEKSSDRSLSVAQDLT